MRAFKVVAKGRLNACVEFREGAEKKGEKQGETRKKTEREREVEV